MVKQRVKNGVESEHRTISLGLGKAASFAFLGGDTSRGDDHTLGRRLQSPQRPRGLVLHGRYPQRLWTSSVRLMDVCIVDVPYLVKLHISRTQSPNDFSSTFLVLSQANSGGR